MDADSEEAKQARSMLLESQLQQQIELELKHGANQSELEKEAQEDRERTFTNLERQTLHQLEQAMKRHETDFQQSLAAKQSKMSVEETDQLIAAHQKETEALKESHEQEREQQKKVQCIIIVIM